MGIVVRDSQGDFFSVAEEGVELQVVKTLESLAAGGKLSEKGAELAAGLARTARQWTPFRSTIWRSGLSLGAPFLGLPVLVCKASDPDDRISELPVSSRSLAEAHTALSVWKKGAQTLNRELRKHNLPPIETNIADFFLKLKPEALAALTVETARAENFLGSMEGYCAYFPLQNAYFERRTNGRWGHTELLALATPFESASAAQTLMRRKGLSGFVIVKTRLQAAAIALNPQNLDLGKLSAAMAQAEADALQEALDAQSLQSLRERAQQLAEKLAQMEAAAGVAPSADAASLAPPRGRRL